MRRTTSTLARSIRQQLDLIRTTHPHRRQTNPRRWKRFLVFVLGVVVGMMVALGLMRPVSWR